MLALRGGAGAPVYPRPTVRSVHVFLGPVAVVANGLVGVWGVLIARRPEVPRSFYWAVTAGIVAMILQVVVGVISMTASDIDPGDQHVFYGGLIAVTFSLAYVYKAQFRRRPALYYGLLMLFTMGLGIRGIVTVGRGF